LLPTMPVRIRRPRSPPTPEAVESVDRLGSDNTGGTEGDASPRSDHQLPRQDSEGQENPPTIVVVESVERLGSCTRLIPEGGARLSPCSGTGGEVQERRPEVPFLGSNAGQGEQSTRGNRNTPKIKTSAERKTSRRGHASSKDLTKRKCVQQRPHQEGMHPAKGKIPLQRECIPQREKPTQYRQRGADHRPTRRCPSLRAG
ncbi:MAG: hypothetical protein ACI8S6_004987, partial [Myxococcota bacterium]